MKRSPWLGVFLCFLAAVPATAHHSLAVYNRLSSKTIVGTVQSFSWSNPHVRLDLMASGAGGAVIHWSFEAGSVNRLAMAGFNRNIVAPGDKITVTYNPKRDGSNAGFLLSITNANGRKFDTRRNRGPTRGGAEEG